MMRRVFLASVVAAVIVAGAVAAVPQDGTTGFNRFPIVDSPFGRMVSGVVGRLLALRSEANITADQRAKIWELHVDHRAQTAATFKLVRDKRVVLRDLVLSGESDEGKLRAAADDLGKVIGDAAVQASALSKEVATMLTDEQRQLIVKFIVENDAAIDDFLDRTIQGE